MNVHNTMNAEDKMTATADKVRGQLKETIGMTTDNDKIVAEGKVDQVKGTTKDKLENVKDVFKK